MYPIALFEYVQLRIENEITYNKKVGFISKKKQGTPKKVQNMVLGLLKKKKYEKIRFWITVLY